jgi:hypothetical protein
MDDFGDLAEHFGCHEGKQVEIHKTSKGAIEAAWEFVQTCSVEADEVEFRKELADQAVLATNAKEIVLKSSQLVIDWPAISTQASVC